MEPAGLMSVVSSTGPSLSTHASLLAPPPCMVTNCALLSAPSRARPPGMTV